MQVELSADGAALDSGVKRRRQPEKGRSRISNGSTLLPTGDGNSIWARLMRDVLASLIVHLGGDASETQRMACRRIAALEAELVHLEDGFARVRAAGGEPEAATVDLYQRISNTQRRLCESIGWERKLRDVTPQDDVSEWIETRLAAKRKPGGEAAAADASAEAPDAGEAISDVPAASETVSECAEGHGSAQAGAAPRDAGAHSRDVCERAGNFGDGGDHD